MIRSPYLKKYQYCIVLATLYSFGRIQCCQYFYRLLPLPSFQSALYKTINGNKTSDRTIWWAARLPPHLEILHSFAHCCMLGKWVSTTPGCDCPAAGNVFLRRHFIRSFQCSGPNSVHHMTSASLASSPCLTRGSAHLVVLQALPAATTSPPRLPDSSQLHSFPVHPSLLDSLELVLEKLSLWRLRFLAESQIHWEMILRWEFQPDKSGYKWVLHWTKRCFSSRQ